VVSTAVLWQAISLSAPVRSLVDERPPGDGLRGTVRARAAAFLATLGAALLLAVVVRFSLWLAGGLWWLAAGALTGVALVIGHHIAPSFLAHISGAQPVSRPSLVERLGALSLRLHVPIESIDALPPHAAATRTALVAGAGSGRRVFIASELIRDWTDDEIAVVVAHEFGHLAHHDAWKSVALDAGVLAAGFGAANLLAPVASSLGVPALQELAALPFVALAAAVVWLMATPLRLAVSRAQERRADAFALDLTGGADAFRAALRRLAASHLAEERPSLLTHWLFHRHPTVAQRLELADKHSGKHLYRSNDLSI
jgi:STE24 endopeptidase